MARSLLVLEHIRDPETGVTYLAGEVVEVGDEEGQVSEQDAERLLTHHAGRVEDTADPDTITPDALELAKTEGVDITTLSGSGSGGKVTKRDVQAAVREREEVAGSGPEEVPPA